MAFCSCRILIDWCSALFHRITCHLAAVCLINDRKRMNGTKKDITMPPSSGFLGNISNEILCRWDSRLYAFPNRITAGVGCHDDSLRSIRHSVDGSVSCEITDLRIDRDRKGRHHIEVLSLDGFSFVWEMFQQKQNDFRTVSHNPVKHIALDIASEMGPVV